MKKLLAVLAFPLLVSTAHAQGAAPSSGMLEMRNTGTPGKAEAKRTVQATFLVKAVDASKRTLTLQAPDGVTRTIQVGPDVKRLDEIAPGDSVRVEFTEGLELALQPDGSPTVAPEAVEAAGRAEKNQAPGAAAVAGIRATVTVTSISLKDRVVIFQGPEGNQYDVKAGPNVQIEKLRVGDRLLATYIQAMALQVEHQKKAK
ncbi:MAG TPA: hypothetical protein VFM53_08245 [Anaeromyxobacteraceae bacterium]|nr:hypothetical protein [Anaeromyxobacteraceae bacterium]